MAIYIALWIVVIICCLIEGNYDLIKIGNKCISSKVVSFIIIFTFLLLLGLFRAEFFGTDQENYYRHYYSYGTYSVRYILSRWTTDDVGYYLLGKLLYMLGANFYIFKCVIYCIIMVLFGRVIYSKSNFPAFSYLILLGTGFLNVNFYLLRISLAVAICFYAYVFLLKKQFWKFFILVLIASMFHKSAIFFLLLYLFVYIKFRGRDLWKKVFMIAVMVIARFTIVPNLYIFYARNDYSDNIVSGKGYNALIFFVVVAIAHTYIYQKRSKIKALNENNYNAISEATTWSTVYMQIEATAFSLMSRVVTYFSFTFAISIPDLLKPRKGRGVIMGFFIVLFSVMYFWRILSNSVLVPYISIWGAG